MLPTIEVNILTFLIFFGSMQALVLAVVIVTTKKFQRKSGYFLAIMMVSFALTNLTTGFFLSGAEDRYELLKYTPNFVITLIPTATYFFLRYLVSPQYNWRWWDYLPWVVVAMETFHRFTRFVLYLTNSPIDQYHSLLFFSSKIYESIAFVATLFIVFWGIKKLKKYEQLIYNNYAEVEDKSLTWLKNCLLLGLAVSSVWLVSLALDHSYDPLKNPVYKFGFVIGMTTIGLTIIICYIGYAMILRQGIIDTDIFGIVQDGDKGTIVGGEPTLSSKTAEHMERVKTLLLEQRLYRNPDLNMTKLAELTGLSNSYLSQIINQVQGQNFFDFINSYRVDEVKALLENPDHAHYTILGIAQESGFKSKSTFNSVFKKMTGMTPSTYKKSLRKED